jgi:hypothetical protein
VVSAFAGAGYVLDFIIDHETDLTMTWAMAALAGGLAKCDLTV